MFELHVSFVMNHSSYFMLNTVFLALQYLFFMLHTLTPLFSVHTYSHVVLFGVAPPCFLHPPLYSIR